MTWTYHAATLTLRGYINGQLGPVCVHPVTPSGMPVPTDMWLGKSAWANDPYLTASMRDFRIFSRTLA